MILMLLMNSLKRLRINNMATLKEFIGTTNIYSEMSGLNNQVPWDDFFDEPSLHAMLLINHGNKEVYEGFNGVPIRTIANMIITKHMFNWQQMKKVIPTTIDISKGEGRTLTETITENGNRNNTSDSVNKVAAYNSDTLITNDGNNLTGNEVTTGTRTKTLTDSKSDLSLAFNHLLLIEKNNIMDVVIKDVSNFLTLSIY